MSIFVSAPCPPGGSGAVDSVNGETGVVVLTTDDISDAAQTNKWATAAEKTKLAFVTVTQAVDLDAVEARVNSLDAAVVLRGSWDASAGTFPGGGTAQAGDSYIVSVAGTVDAVAFSVGDRIIAIVDNASTATFAANWLKADYTDQVLSVVGQTGAVTASQILTALLTVDGSGSGLDADLLDGLSSAAFQQVHADLTDLIDRWTAASAAGPSSLEFREDTDNGTSEVTVVAPAALTADVVATLPSTSGTLLTEAGAAALYSPILNVPVAVAGTSDTLAAGDNGKYNYYTDAALVTVEIPTDAEDDLPDGFSTSLTAAGAAGLTLDVTGVTVVGGANTTIAQGETMVVIKTAAANTWLVIGGTS